MRVVQHYWLSAFLAVVSAQRLRLLVEAIVNDVIQPNDGLFSNVVEQFGIVSFSPTPSGTPSISPSVSPTASVSAFSSPFPSPTTSASTSNTVTFSSASPSPTPISSSSPSPSTSARAELPPPTSAAQERRVSPNPSPSTFVSPTASASPVPDVCLSSVTVPTLQDKTIRFEYYDADGGDTIDFEASVEFDGSLLGHRCPLGQSNNYIAQREFANDLDIVFFLADMVKRDQVLQRSNELTIKGGVNVDRGNPAGLTPEVLSVAAFIYEGDFRRGTVSSEERLPLFQCCRLVGLSDGGACPTSEIGKLTATENSDGSVTLTSTMTDPLSC